MEITRPNQVWAMDITYIPMARGFVYLAVVLDWAPAGSVVAALDHDGGGVLRRDAGGCFWRVTAGPKSSTRIRARSSPARPSLDNDIAIRMDGRGAWRDNVFVERPWRSVKYEEVYLRAYDTVSDARASIGRYPDFYNGRRPHSSRDGSTPDQAYFNPPPIRMAA